MTPDSTDHRSQEHKSSHLEAQLESAQSLLESAQLLHSSLDLDQLLRHLLRSVMGRLLVSKGLIAVEEDGGVRLALVRGLPKLAVGEKFDEEIARDAGLDLILPIGDEARGRAATRSAAPRSVL